MKLGHKYYSQKELNVNGIHFRIVLWMSEGLSVFMVPYTSPNWALKLEMSKRHWAIHITMSNYPHQIHLEIIRHLVPLDNVSHLLLLIKGISVIQIYCFLRKKIIYYSYWTNLDRRDFAFAVTIAFFEIICIQIFFLLLTIFLL